MAHNSGHLVLFNQSIGNIDCLLRFASIVAFDCNKFNTVYAASRIDIFNGLGSTTPELLAKSRIRAGVGSRYTYFDFSTVT